MYHLTSILNIVKNFELSMNREKADMPTLTVNIASAGTTVAGSSKPSAFGTCLLHRPDTGGFDLRSILV